ncbi:MAG: FG-GAP-like repeat-containing protein, partial [Cytophagales bacterium]|nr:FG-GAP-like repeat-containing protein [Cytophagales bacterium]
VTQYSIQNVQVFLGNGNGTLNSPIVQSLSGHYPYFLRTGDFNNDGQKDVIFSELTNFTFGVLLGKGNGSFQTASFFTNSFAMDDLTVGDFNGDGNTDAAFSNYADNFVSVFLGSNSGNFNITSQNFVSAGPRGIETADFDGDGKLDLAVTCYNADVVNILKGGGDGSFTLNASYPSSANPNDVAVGDFNNDNAIDFAVSENGNNQWQVYQNNCTPALYPPPGNVLNFGSGSSSVVAGPINLAGTDFTIEFWVKHAATYQGNHNMIISQGQLPAATNNFLDLGIDNGNLYLEFWNNRITNPGIFDSNWHHVAFTVLSTGQRAIYVDGVQTIADANTGAYTGFGNLFIGAESNTYGAPYEGSLDELAIWHTIRTQAQIQGDMLGFINPATATGLVAYYDFNQGIPGGDNTTPPVNTLNDAFGNHGILNGFALNGNVSNWINSGSYLSVPGINSFTPISGRVGTIVTVYGANFDLVPANNIVNFNGSTTTASSSNTNYLVVTVPSGASTGLLTVSVAGQSGTSLSAFTVLPPSQPLGNRGIYLDGNTSAGSNLITSFVPTNATDNITLEAWVKLRQYPISLYNSFLVYNGNSSTDGYGIFINNTGASIFIAGLGGIIFNAPISLNQWTHLAIVRNSGN